MQKRQGDYCLNPSIGKVALGVGWMSRILSALLCLNPSIGKVAQCAA